MKTFLVLWLSTPNIYIHNPIAEFATVTECRLEANHLNSLRIPDAEGILYFGCLSPHP